MTTIVDNTIETTPHEAKANGAHANGTKVRAPRKTTAESPFAQIATDAIIKKGLDAKAEAMARLKTLEDERGKLMEFLGLGPQHTTSVETMPGDFMAAMTKSKAPRVKDGIRKVEPKTKKARAKRATGEETLAAQDAVMTLLKDSTEELPASDITATTGLDKAVVARTLKTLKASGKIEQAGKAKAAKYSIA